MRHLELQEVSTVDLYYIAQIIDGVVREPLNYLRNIEDIFGDMSSVSTTQAFPKWTCLHEFIEACISSIALEQANNRSEVVNGGFWVDHLFAANGVLMSYDIFINSSGRSSPNAYFELLTKDGWLSDIAELVAKQVFYVLFGNRITLLRFNEMISYYVSEVAPSFAPEAFSENGSLIRKQPPRWAQDAVFHRDRGMCVQCGKDLTRLINRQDKIHLDHIIPLRSGGMNCVTNLQILCSQCNLSKGARNSSTSSKYESWYNYD